MAVLFCEVFHSVLHGLDQPPIAFLGLAMPVFRYSFQNWAVQAPCLVGVGAGAESSSLPPTKKKEQNSAALVMGSAVDLREGCASLSVPGENSRTASASLKRSKGK